METPIEKIKTEVTEENGEKFQVEYEILSHDDSEQIQNSDYRKYGEQISEIDGKLNSLNARVEQLNSEIDTLTNHADNIDYAVAIASGVLCGMIDAIFVGEFDFEGSWENVNKQFQDIVSKQSSKVEKGELDQKIQKAIEKAKEKAKEKGEPFDDSKAKEIASNIRKKFDEDHNIELKIQQAIDKARQNGEDLDADKINAIREKINNNEMARKIKKLEDTFGIPSDNVWDVAGNGIDAKSHHLDDLAHHPTVIGWAVSIITQFTGKAYFQNKDGKNLKYDAQRIKIIDNVNAYIKYGFTREIDRKTKNGGSKKALEVTLIGDDLKTKLACGTLNWLGHLISDLAGSNGSAKKGNAGMGLPGPILSALKEFAMLPLIRKTNLPQLLNDLFTKDNALFEQYRFDLRSELALGTELGKQAIPVFINEFLVRTFYFIRRLTTQLQNVNSFKDINWKEIKPWKNRTIARMITIASGTFMAVDMADAAIHGVIESGGTLAGFGKGFIVRVNFVGVGRFAIAVGSDIAMGAKKERLKNERLQLYMEMLHWSNAKVFYAQANMWVDAKSAQDAIIAAYHSMETAYAAFSDMMKQMQRTVESVDTVGMEENNPGLANELLEFIQQ